ncbi:MAG: sigma-54 dependent transcriptional regulator [Acidobacteriaceae bacterium]
MMMTCVAKFNSNGAFSGFTSRSMQTNPWKQSQRHSCPGRTNRSHRKIRHMATITKSDLIAHSPEFRSVPQQVSIVAPTDCTVVIQGETGTGKELVAREIHDQSLRRCGPFVKINCAAIPGGLLESEMFGHEKGAFTGAVAQTTGRFQLAHGGTLFLDEIGDLPLELQPKLLRVLQEREFERLGSSRTVRVDVRVIAATNQDLGQMVENNRYRADLYYRLNVFPMILPALRDRPQDVPPLVRHFMGEFSSRMNKEVKFIPDQVMRILQHHEWPGNVRELRNFTERAVLLTAGSVLTPPLAELKRFAAKARALPQQTLAELERAYIVETLRESNWVIGGGHGAAARLGLPRTTLLSRMRRHGISKDMFRSRAFSRPDRENSSGPGELCFSDAPSPTRAAVSRELARAV